MVNNIKKKFLNYYSENKKYFELREQSRLQEEIFPIHKEILEKCRKKKGLIVDLGCGTGLDTLAMSGQENFCLGIDISQLAINKAKARKIKNADFLKSDLENLPLNSKSVDVITSFYTFEHLFDTEKVLSEIDRVLKSKGEIFLLCPNYVSPFRGAPAFGGVRKIKIAKKMILLLSRIFNVWFLRKKEKGFQN